MSRSSSSRLFSQNYGASAWTGDFVQGSQALKTAGLRVSLDRPARCVLAEYFVRTGHPGLAGDLYQDLANDSRCPEGLFAEVPAGFGYLRMDEARDLDLEAVSCLFFVTATLASWWFDSSVFE